MKRLLLTLLGVCYATSVLAGETGMAFPQLAEEIDLTVPQSPKQMEQLLDDNAPCKGCGVVTDVRQVKDKAAAREDAIDPYLVEVARSDDNGKVQVDYLTDSDTLDRYGGAMEWLITVRFDDGAYEDYYQETQPSVQQGDHVRVVSGQVVLR